jgi:hypothetical protein
MWKTALVQLEEIVDRRIAPGVQDTVQLPVGRPCFHYPFLCGCGSVDTALACKLGTRTKPAATHHILKRSKQDKGSGR